MSESELMWKRPKTPLEFPLEVVRALRAADAAGFRDRAGEKVLKKFCEDNRDALGLIPEAKLHISPFHQSIRFVGAELDVAEELVCQVIQSVRGTFGAQR